MSNEEPNKKPEIPLIADECIFPMIIEDIQFNTANQHRWADDIFTAFNNENFANPKAKEEKWSAKYFPNSIELLQSYVVFSQAKYDLLDSKKLVNRGFCPITGEDINQAFFYELFGRKVYISEKGKQLMKEWDKTEHIRLFGKEPLSDVQMKELREHVLTGIQEKKKGKIMLFVIAIMLILLLIKFC